MRWFFHYLTVDRPVGGLKQIRLAAALLRDAGVETFLVRDRTYQKAPPGTDDAGLYGVPVPDAGFQVEDAADHLGPDDVLILSEVVLAELLAPARGRGFRLGMFNQNGFYALRQAPPRSAVRGAFEFALANAGYVGGVCQTAYALPPERVFVLPYWVARGPFAPDAASAPARELAVAYMPRKLPEVAARVRDLVGRSHPDVRWVEIDGLPEAEVARRLRGAAVFLATQHWEGFGLPAVEAMACGCLVAGFAGTAPFPSPYATPANGFWAPDGDATAAAVAVGRAIDVAKVGGEARDRVLAAGRATAARYEYAPAIAAWAAAADVIRRRAYRDRTDAPPRPGWRDRLAQLRVLSDAGRLGWAGRVLGLGGWVTRPLRRLAAGRSRGATG